MFLVILIHLMTKTSALSEMNPSQPIYYISWFLYALCMTGVNCYVLISGYFWTETKFRLEKLLHIYFQVLFYSVTIAVVMYACKMELKSSWICVFLPVTNSEYWFATIYLGLYCLTPYLSLIIQNMEEKPFRKLLMILGILLCVIPTFLRADGWLGDGGAYGISWFIYLYLMGGYIRKYYPDGEKKACRYYLASVLWRGVQTNYWLAEKEDIFSFIGIWMAVFIVCGIVEALRQCLFKWLKIDSLINKLAYFLKTVGRKALNFFPEEESLESLQTYGNLKELLLVGAREI